MASISSRRIDLHDWDATKCHAGGCEFQGRAAQAADAGHRNGFFYVLDRVTGQFLSATPFVKN
jgi:glucose dehydrogenase